MTGQQAVLFAAMTLGLLLSQAATADAQLGPAGAGSTVSDPIGLGTDGLGTGGASGLATPANPSAGSTTGAVGMDGSGAGTSTGSNRPSPGGPACAPPGSAAAFAGTSQPLLCPGTSSSGGGSGGAAFSVVREER